MSLGISTGIVAGLIALILLLYFSGGAAAPTIEVRPEFGQVRQESGNFYLPVTIGNSGSATAEDVILEVTLTDSSGQQEASEVTIRFLAGNATEGATVVFGNDPRDGQVSIDVKSYLNP